jgi:hypothetical protein
MSDEYKIVEGSLKVSSKKAETDARSALAGNLVREEDRRLKKIKTGGQTCKARFRSGRCRSIAGLN